MRVNLICYFIAILISFFTRKIFLDRLGPEFIGLTTTVNSLLGFLNLAELGVGTSIAYFLYKPIYEGNRKRINELISIMGYLYRIIGSFIGVSGLLASAFLPLIFKDTEFSYGTLYYCFYAQLCASLLGYFINYKATTIFAADQRNYLVTGYFQASQFLMTLMQAAMALYIQSYAIYITITLLSSIVNSYILNWKFRSTYGWVQTDIRQGRIWLKACPEILVYVKRVFVHSLGGFVIGSVMPLVIYSYATLTMVTMYGNYSILNSKIASLISNALSGTGASVGNLIAEGNTQKTYNCYKELYSIKFLLVGVLSLCLVHLSSSFVAVWLGAEYVLAPVIVWLMCADFALNIIRGTTEEFLSGFGLKADVWVPLCRVGSLIFIVLGGYYYGLIGILIPPVIVQISLMHLWKSFYLYRDGLKVPFRDYFVLLMENIAPLIVGFAVALFVEHCVMGCNGMPTSSWMDFCKSSVVFCVPMIVVSFVISYFTSSGFRLFLGRVNQYGKRLFQ